MRRALNPQDYDQFAERLIPRKITISRVKGNFVFFFEVDGHVGEGTGEKYISRDQKRRMNFIVQGVPEEDVVSISTPNVMVRGGGFATEYDEDYVGRFNTVGINPGMAFAAAA